MIWFGLVYIYIYISMKRIFIYIYLYKEDLTLNNLQCQILFIYIYIYIYIYNLLVGFYGISTIVGYLMSNPLYTYILNVCFGLVGSYDTSTTVGYLMLNPVFTYIWFVNTFCRYVQLNDQTVLFQTIQFSLSHLFVHSLNVKQFCLTHR